MRGFARTYLVKHWPYFAAGVVCLILTNYLTILIPLKVKDVIDSFAHNDQGLQSLRSMIFVIVGLATAMFVVRSLSRILIFYPGRYVEYEVRKDVYHHLMRLGQPFYRRFAVGDLMSRMLNDINNIRLMVGLAVLHVLNTVLIYVLVFYQMRSISLELLVFVLCPIPLAVLLVLRLAKNLYRYTGRTQKRLGDLTNFIVEALGGVHIIKSFSAEEGVLQAFDRENLAYERNHLKVCRIRAQMFPFIGIISSLGQLILFVVGGRMVIEQRLSLGEFVAVSAYLHMLAWPTAAFAWIIHIVQRGRVSLNRVQDILQARPQVADSSVTDMALQASASVGIAVKDLSFKFHEDGADILKDVSFEVKPGQSLGVFGATGSGKSVLAQLLAGVEKAPLKSICVNNRPLEEWPLQSFRSMLAYVPQSSFLFSKSIADNIAYAHFDENLASDERVLESSQMACVAEDIALFPQKYQTLVGEKGVVLSGGQRNRISLARSLYKDYSLLILDDILSAVDHKTEAALVKSIFAHQPHSTKVIVSHRVSALTRCDNIIVLEHGAVVAQGRHEELVQQDGIYRDTWLYQKMEQEQHG